MLHKNKTMNVADLKKILDDYPDDMIVCVNTPGDTYDEIRSASKELMSFDATAPRTMGRYYVAYPSQPSNETNEVLLLQ